MPTKKAEAPAKSGSALDKRLGNPVGEASWNIATLKQNLQEDSAILEATLREANKLLSESGAPPLVDVGGVANKDRLRSATELAHKTSTGSRRDSTLEGHSQGGEGGDRAGKGAAFVASADFLIAMNDSKLGVEPKVIGFTATMSEECAARIKALEKVITKEGAQIIKKSVQSDMDAVCRISRSLGGGGAGGSGGAAMEGLIEELESRIVEEEMLKNSALDHGRQLQEQLRAQNQQIAELQDKMDYIEGTTQEGTDQLRRSEIEMNQMREELQVSQNKMRGEEGEKLKMMERIRKRDIETGKMKETMDKMTWQLRALGEERDHMHQTLEDTKSRHHELQFKLTQTQEELSKHQNAERVMKRNLQLQMPDEIKKVVKRVEELDKVNRDLTSKLAALGGGKGDPAHDPGKRAESLKQELAELKINYKMVTQNYEGLKRDHDAMERRFETNIRLAENRSRTLFDKTVMYTQKLQGATDIRVQEKLSSKSSGNELTALRRKNMDLLGQLNRMEEGLLLAQAREKEAESRCVTLQEKIDLFAMIQKIDISNLSYSSDARTEDDVDRIFVQRSGMIPRLKESQGRASNSQGSQRFRNMSFMSNEDSSRNLGGRWSGRPPTADGSFRMEGRGEEREREKPRAQSAASTVSEARAEVGSLEAEALYHKLAVLQAKASSEEKARLAAQERAVGMAEQLLDKEKEIANLQTIITSGENVSKIKKPLRDKVLQNDKTLKLQNKMRDMETVMQKVENKLSEKEEECRIKARKISELLFKLQVEEDSNLRIQDQIIDLKGQIKKKDEEAVRLTATQQRDREDREGISSEAAPIIHATDSKHQPASAPARVPATMIAQEALGLRASHVRDGGTPRTSQTPRSHMESPKSSKPESPLARPHASAGARPEAERVASLPRAGSPVPDAAPKQRQVHAAHDLGALEIVDAVPKAPEAAEFDNGPASPGAYLVRPKTGGERSWEAGPGSFSPVVGGASAAKDAEAEGLSMISEH